MAKTKQEAGEQTALLDKPRVLFSEPGGGAQVLFYGVLLAWGCTGAWAASLGLPGAGGATARFGGGRGVFGLFPVFIFDEKALLGGLLGGDCPVGGGGVVFL